MKNLFDRYPSDDWMNTQYSKKKEIVEKSINDFENKYQIEELLYFDNIQDDCIRLTIGVKKK